MTFGSREWMKSRQRRWDEKHMRTASCRIPRKDYELLKMYCEDMHTNTHRILRAYIAFVLRAAYGQDALTGSMKYAATEALKHVMERA